LNLLILTHVPRPIDIDKIFRCLSGHAAVEVRYLPKEAYKNLKETLKQFDLSGYDRILCDLPFSRMVKQRRILSRIPNLVLYEEDACQDFIPESRWYKKFRQLYRSMKQARAIHTGHQVSRDFRAMGIDSVHVSKGYDSSRLYDMKTQRRIPLAFIGALRSAIYYQRRAAVNYLKEMLNLQIVEARGIEAYREALNSIAIFFSADIGLREYMAKNFEAMACGCAVVAYRQGNGEEDALGLKDMENIVLYSSLAEAEARIRYLFDHPEIRCGIAEAGKEHVGANFEFRHLATQIYEAIQPPIASKKKRFRWV
jgi:glycosyltransferase involved in cell wall biosynthesis